MTKPKPTPTPGFRSGLAILAHLHALGYQVSKTKLYDDMRDHPRNFPKRNGLYLPGPVERYAKTLTRRDTPVEPAKPEDQTDTEREKKAGADLKTAQAAKEKFKLELLQGRYTETATIGRELGLRAKAFRLSLEKFGHEQSPAVAAVFGGEREAALDLCAALGLGEDKMPAVIDWAQGRAPQFRALFEDRIADTLDAYATGHWWDEEMRLAWERFQAMEDRDA